MSIVHSLPSSDLPMTGSPFTLNDENAPPAESREGHRAAHGEICAIERKYGGVSPPIARQ